MSRQIVRQAPYLRRYARALTGDQVAGDGLVERTMEGLLAGALPLAEDLPLRVGLYRALHRVWLEPGALINVGASGSSADQRLQTLSPDQRTALLLTAMEGFSLAEAALILDQPTGRLAACLDEAQANLARAIATQVMIIEDEPIIALDLTRLVRELGHEVVGTAATHAEAVALAAKTAPGLVLADVRLADGSNGMEAVAEILTGFDIPVIFITAFPEYLLTGERPEPAFLMTKPFREDAVKAMIAQALFFHQPATERPPA